MPDILITENICGIAVDALSSRFDVTFLPELWEEPTELLKRIGDFRAIIVRNQTQVTASLLKAGKKLVVVGRAGVGLDNVDVDAATQAGILITSTPDQNAISVAELAMGLMLSLARMISVTNQDTKDGNWRRQKVSWDGTLRQNDRHHRRRQDRVPDRATRTVLRDESACLRSIHQPR